MTKKKNYIFLILYTAIILSANNCFSQDLRKDVDLPFEVMVKNAKDHGFLWSARKGNITLFLYGTLHFGKYSWDFPGPTISKSMLKSDTLFLETDISSTETYEQMKKIYDDKIEKKVSYLYSYKKLDEYYKVFSKNYKDSDIPIYLKYASVEINASRAHGLYPEYAIDISLLGFASATGKNIVYLENGKEQGIALSEIYRTSYGDNVKRFIDYYESGNISNDNLILSKIWSESSNEKSEEFYEKAFCQGDCGKNSDLNSYRNIRFVSRIENNIDNKGGFYFIALGFTHFFGPNSVLVVLRRAGYKITQIIPKE